MLLKCQTPHFFRPCILRVTSLVFSTLLSRVSCAPINSHLLYGGGEPTGASARNINRIRSLRYVRDRVTNGGRGLSYSVESIKSGFPYFAMTVFGCTEGNLLCACANSTTQTTPTNKRQDRSDMACMIAMTNVPSNRRAPTNRLLLLRLRALRCIGL